MEVENVRRKLERELELELGDDYHVDFRSKITDFQFASAYKY
jgi:hypothetical protein